MGKGDFSDFGFCMPYMESVIGTGRLIIWLIIIAFRIDLSATFGLQSI